METVLPPELVIGKGFWPHKEIRPTLKVAFEGFWDKDSVIWPHYFCTSHCFLWNKWDVKYDNNDPDVIFTSIFSGSKHSNPRNVPRILLIHENLNVYKDATFDQFAGVISFTDSKEQPNNIRIPYWVYRLFDQYASHCVFPNDVASDSLVSYEEYFTETYLKGKSEDALLDLWLKRSFCAHVQGKAVEWREKVYNELSKYKQIDCGGSLHPNLPDGKEKEEMAKRLYGVEANRQKYNFFSQRKFSICMENDMNTVGYVTEKIIDSYFAVTIPLYAGQMNSKDGFNKKAFVNLYDYDTMASWITTIMELDNNNEKYLEMLSQPLFTSFPEEFTLPAMIETYSKLIGG